MQTVKAAKYDFVSDNLGPFLLMIQGSMAGVTAKYPGFLKRGSTLGAYQFTSLSIQSYLWEIHESWSKHINRRGWP